jgi:4-amino-4-deoxy-L-arabinose transferase-like glycosyltransferase
VLKNRKIIFIFILALSIRLSYVLFYPQISLAGSDAKEYDLIAEGLLKGKGFPVGRLSQGQVEIVRPPGYPLFLSAIYLVSGHNYTAVRVIQAVLSSVLIFIIFLLAKNIFSDERTAYLSSLLYALHPALIAYTGLLYTESIFIILLVLSMFFLYKGLSAAKTKFYILTGITLGAATMVSSRSLFLPILIFLGILFIIKQKRFAFKIFFIIILTMCVIFFPWTIRNYFVSGGKFILLENYSSATALWLATNPEGKILEWNYDEEPLKSLVGKLPPQERTPVIRKEAIKNLKKYPLAYLKNSVRRFFILLVAGHSNCFKGLEKSTFQTIKDREIGKAIIKIFLLSFNILIIILGIVGIYITKKNWKINFPILIPIIYTILIHTFYVAAPRLQIPMLPFLIIFASLTIIYIKVNYNKWRELKWAK